MFDGVAHFAKRHDARWKLREVFRVDVILAVFSLSMGKYRVGTFANGHPVRGLVELAPMQCTVDGQKPRKAKAGARGPTRTLPISKSMASRAIFHTKDRRNRLGAQAGSDKGVHVPRIF